MSPPPQALESAERKRQEKQQEQEANLAEIAHLLRGDLLSENPQQAASSFGPHRVVPDRWKGMSREQLEEIRLTQQQQVQEKLVPALPRVPAALGHLMPSAPTGAFCPAETKSQRSLPLAGEVARLGLGSIARPEEGVGPEMPYRGRGHWGRGQRARQTPEALSGLETGRCPAQGVGQLGRLWSWDGGGSGELGWARDGQAMVASTPAQAGRNRVGGSAVAMPEPGCEEKEGGQVRAAPRRWGFSGRGEGLLRDISPRRGSGRKSASVIWTGTGAGSRVPAPRCCRSGSSSGSNDTCAGPWTVVTAAWPRSNIPSEHDVGEGETDLPGAAPSPHRTLGESRRLPGRGFKAETPKEDGAGSPPQEGSP